MDLALFPMHVVLFPGCTLPVQVFEPRYRAMMDHVLADTRRLGVIAIARGMEVGGPAETYDVGCIAEVQQVQRADDGRMQIILLGHERFRIEQRYDDDPYPRAAVNVIIEEEAGAGATAALGPARAATRRYISVVAQMQGADVVVPNFPDDPVAASFMIANTLQLDLPARQALLEAQNARARLELASDLGKREALLLEAVGPSVGRPRDGVSLN